ncbi:DUF3106 domain-containing protein [Lysobacter sp. KIS68-7]|uniref:DUF3106 domain-containing protein n=1 Tax=Lysobacter sp. KIS68-7 TaxID=2904252 RepID=UPI001E28BDEE|nr:DUF3106 domain-containing protein [Lysobacter sp. KIS68-7]UHQ20325.1 DUF3106 domain-containing protein [Lysobacter sp. KIS68-7]
MTAQIDSPPSSTGAPTAFLRGVERRAALLAELQCGDARRGDVAVAATLRAFAGSASATPMSGWPVRFWSLLLAAPDLRRQAEDARWTPPWLPLGALGNGPRAALLLRLVGGLEMEDAATSLGVSLEAYRAALQRAIPYRDDGTPDREAWQGWVDAVRTRVAEMPAERLARMQGTGSAPSPIDAPEPVRTEPAVATAAIATPAAAPHTETRDGRAPRPHRLRMAIVAGLLAVAGIGVAVYLLQPGWLDRLPGRGIRTRTLPPADEPAARFDADFAAWTHRDFFAIADVDGLHRAQDLPFFAWYAAQRAVQPAQEAATPASAITPVVPAAVLAEPAPPPSLPPPRATPLQAPANVLLPAVMSSVIAHIPAPVQADLREQAALWTAWSPAQRTDFARRVAQWDAQPRERRAQWRVAYQAWRHLDPVAAEAVENAVQAFAQLAPEDQARLRAEFDALDATTQRGWLLGPAIGADYPKLQPLLAQMPESQHEAMLRMLRSMDSAQRADLAVLAQRVPPQAREELVRNVLSTSDANRAAWLRARLEQ